MSRLIGLASRLRFARKGPRRPRRVGVPSILQMEAVECGAASLAMILAHYRRAVGLEELRVACGVSRDGSRAQNILKAARGYGLIAKAFKKEVAELRTVPPPFIVHWNFNHFLVVEGFRGKRVFLNDPATGPRSVTEPEFDSAFTGVVLTFQPEPTFERGGQRPSMRQALLRRLSGTGAAQTYLFVIGVLLMMLTMIMPSLQGIFIDDVLIKGIGEWTYPLVAALLVTAAGLALVTSVQSWYAWRLRLRLGLSGSAKVFSHMLSLPVGFFAQRNAGELATRVALNDRVSSLLSTELGAGILGLLGILVFGGFMVAYDWLLTTIVLFSTVINVAVVQWSARKRLDLSRRLSQEQGKMMGPAMGGLKSIEAVKAMSGESDFFSRWSGFQTKVLGGQQSVKLQTEMLSVVPVVLVTLNGILILGIGGLRVMDGRLSIGMLIAVQALAMLIASPVQQVVSFATSLPEVEAQVGRLEDVLQTPADPQVRPPTAVDTETASEKLAGLVELRGLTYGYNPLDPPLIDNFNLTLRPGSRVALVGGSGSGKSTVVSLVCGLFEPWEGEILFDGISRRELSHYKLSQSFGVVDQDVFLFEGSVRENLTLWDSTVPDADVVSAAADACVHEEVMSRPGGYGSHVEEGGRNFSGGQAQRLEIARALVGNPTVLVLDEATSALDPVTERVFDENLRRRGCTCLLIAHRLSTIRDCDEIVVLDKGRIVQRGTHDELKAVPGHYAKLISSEAA
jgi:NHLM bacteriocin system ABC transporter peptidase/ATP-binding protein